MQLVCTENLIRVDAVMESDTVYDKPIVGPTDQIHHGREIGRGRNRIEQPEGRELRWD
jgi:hypothetical protein